MKRANYTPPATKETVSAKYINPVFDKLLGRTTLEWNCGDHVEKLTASLRFTDYEGNTPSLYSISKLPYIIKTYFNARKSPIMERPVPFLTMDAIKFMDALIRPGLRILEIGGGNSSLWFLERGVNLTTYEHDASWGEMISNEVSKHPEHYHAERFHLRIMQGEDTVKDLEKLENKHYDIALVDCMNDFTRRTECVKAIKDKVKDGGWMVLDNSDNPANWTADEILSGKEMHRFTGYAPMSLFVCQTSFWRM